MTVNDTQEPLVLIDDHTALKDNDTPVWDIIIIGGGPAGLSAGIYASRAGRKTLVLEGELTSATDYPGGQLMLTPSLENYPGFTGGSGEEFIEVLRSQVDEFGAVRLEERVNEIIFSEDGSAAHQVSTYNGHTYRSHKVIVATGAIARRLGVENEDNFYGNGVSSCATCDGSFFKGSAVAVVGGGDVAVEDALYMTQHASHVYLIHRRDALRTDSPEARALASKPNVTILWNTTVESIYGEYSVEGVNIKTNGEETKLPISGLFVAIGHDPQTELFKSTDIIEVDSWGYVVADGVKTNIPGVYVAGDVADPIYRQAITAAASGAMAAIEATRSIA